MPRPPFAKMRWWLIWTWAGPHLGPCTFPQVGCGRALIAPQASTLLVWPFWRKVRIACFCGVIEMETFEALRAMRVEPSAAGTITSARAPASRMRVGLNPIHFAYPSRRFPNLLENCAWGALRRGVAHSERAWGTQNRLPLLS